MDNKQNNNKYDNLSIYQKYIALIEYSNIIIRKYPKNENFALVQEIKNTLYSGLKCLIFAIKTYNKELKLKYLNELDINLNILKTQIRLSFKFKYISIQNYETWSKHLTEICNILGKWILTCLKK